jgi:hypothetical protein
MMIKMEPSLSRYLIIISTITSGICVICALTIAIYVFVHTPDIQSVPIYENGFILRRESKVIHLFGPIVIQVLVFALLFYHSMRWKNLQRNILESLENLRSQNIRWKNFDAGWAYKLACYGFMGFEISILAVIALNSYRLLKI